MAHANEHAGTKEHHNYSREKGYESAEYAHQEYPKYVGDVQVANAKEEKAALKAQAEAQAEKEAAKPAE